MHRLQLKKMLHSSKRFCPSCGNPIEGKGDFCKDCSKTDFEFKDINILLCNNCKSYQHKNKWHKYKIIDTVVKNVAKDNIKAKITVQPLGKDVAKEMTSWKAGVKKDYTITVKHKGRLFDIPIRLDITLCPKCSKSGTKYYESILQLRNSNDTVYTFAIQDIKKQKPKGIHLNKEVRIGDEYADLYLTNKTYASVLANKIKKEFGGTIKKNAQHFSVDWVTSKVIYRLHVLVNIPKYRKGDVIRQDDALMKIISLKDKVHVVNLRNNSKTSLAYKDYDILKPVEFQVIKKYPEYEILDPATYYQARLMNPTKSLEINHKIKVIIDGGEAWMV